MGFVRIGSGKSSGGGDRNYSPKIHFDLPVCQYSSYGMTSKNISKTEYSPNINGNGFSLTYNDSNRGNDGNEGIGFMVTGLNPTKAHLVTYTIRGESHEGKNPLPYNTTSSNGSNAVGFCQGLINLKSCTDARVFNLTNPNFKYGYINFVRMLFPNQMFGGRTGEEMTNFTPFTTLTKNPVSYSLTIKKGCNDIAFLMFETAYPNDLPLTYYFENFTITPIDDPISISLEPFRLGYTSIEDRNVRGTTTVSNLPTTNLYEVLKMRVRGKCEHGSFELKTHETDIMGNDYLNPYLASHTESIALNNYYTVCEYDHIGYIDKTYIIGVNTKNRTTPLTLEAYYYADSNFEYEGDYIEVTYETTGSASSTYAYEYTKGDVLYCTCNSEQEARSIAGSVSIEFKEFDSASSKGYFYTAENPTITISRGNDMGYDLRQYNPLLQPGLVING